MVLHYLPERLVPADGAHVRAPSGPTAPSPRAGFVVGRAVGNSVVRHRVTRQLRAAVREHLHRLPASADLVVRARPEAATAGFAQLSRDLATGLDRLAGTAVPR